MIDGSVIAKTEMICRKSLEIPSLLQRRDADSGLDIIELVLI